MSESKRIKREAAVLEEAEEDQAALHADGKEAPLEDDADAAGDLDGAAAEEAYDYEAEENEFLTALADVQEKLIEVGTLCLGVVNHNSSSGEKA